MSDHFTDPDGDALTYTVTVSRPHYVTTALIPRQTSGLPGATYAPGSSWFDVDLRIHGQTVGDVVVTVVATDAIGLTETLDIAVTVVASALLGGTALISRERAHQLITARGESVEWFPLARSSGIPMTVQVIEPQPDVEAGQTSLFVAAENVGIDLVVSDVTISALPDGLKAVLASTNLEIILADRAYAGFFLVRGVRRQVLGLDIQEDTGHRLFHRFALGGAYLVGNAPPPSQAAIPTVSVTQGVRVLGDDGAVITIDRDDAVTSGGVIIQRTAAPITQQIRVSGEQQPLKTHRPFHDGQVGVEYDPVFLSFYSDGAYVLGSGGTPINSSWVSPGLLPPGLSKVQDAGVRTRTNSTGEWITGVPTQPGVFIYQPVYEGLGRSFTILVFNADGTPPPLHDWSVPELPPYPDADSRVLWSYVIPCNPYARINYASIFGLPTGFGRYDPPFTTPVASVYGYAAGIFNNIQGIPAGRQHNRFTNGRFPVRIVFGAEALIEDVEKVLAIGQSSVPSVAAVRPTQAVSVRAGASVVVGLTNWIRSTNVRPTYALSSAPSWVTLSGSTLTIAPGASVTPQDYTATVTASGTGVSDAVVTLTVTVTVPPAAAPLPSAPGNPWRVPGLRTSTHAAYTPRGDASSPFRTVVYVGTALTDSDTDWQLPQSMKDAAAMRASVDGVVYTWNTRVSGTQTQSLSVALFSAAGVRAHYYYWDATDVTPNRPPADAVWTLHQELQFLDTNGDVITDGPLNV